MSSRTKEQKRARAIQKDTGWAYMECLRLANAGITDHALAELRAERTRAIEKVARFGERYGKPPGDTP